MKYRTMADLAYATIRRQILIGELAAGQRIDQDAEAQRIQVSRMPIREALRRLEAEGLVEIAHHRGAHVRAMSGDDLEELYVMRIALEPVAGRLGAVQITSEILGELNDLLPRMESIVSEVDAVAWLKVDWIFHSTLYESAQHPRLLRTIQGLWEEVGRYRKLKLAFREELELSLAEHRAVIDACVRHDGIEVEQIIRDSLERSRQTLPDLLRRTGLGEGNIAIAAVDSQL